MNLIFRVHQNHQLVFNYLSDMQKFVTVHPVISKMNSIGKDHYLVYETLSFCKIPFSFTYFAWVDKNERDQTIVLRAKVFRVTKIEMKFTLFSEQDYTIINEQIEFKTILPIKFILKRIFRKQHKLLFENINLVEA